MLIFGFEFEHYKNHFVIFIFSFLDAIASLDWGYEREGGSKGVITKP